MAKLNNKVVKCVNFILFLQPVNKLFNHYRFYRTLNKTNTCHENGSETFIDVKVK